MGRPSSFTQEVADSICDQIAHGKSLRKICEADGMPVKQTVLNWLNDERHSAFLAQYMRAREEQADFYAEEILEISDDGRNDYYVTEDGAEIVNHDHIARSRLRVDSRKWLASKLAPKKYGDKVEHDHSGVVQIERIEYIVVDTDEAIEYSGTLASN